jgi:hypothetical protein
VYHRLPPADPDRDAAELALEQAIERAERAGRELLEQQERDRQEKGVLVFEI